ncbi:MAG: cell envelope integrity protein CreD [Rheinheimera sp.]|nr:MAG: cell envelope integrity protein CreD [Rheinheimera sp.]
MLKHKIILVAALIALLWLPVGVIHNLVLERAELNQQVQQQIADSSGGPQLLSGPLLVLELEATQVPSTDKTAAHRQYLLQQADDLQLSSEVQTEQRSRGLYRARVYQSQHQMKASFAAVAAELLANTAAGQADAPRIKAAWISFAVNDSRGFTRLPQLKLNGELQHIATGSKLSFLPEGFHLPLPLSQLEQAMILELSLELQGSTSLNVLPVARNSQWQLRSNWPDPAFQGRYLPQQREISPSGFSAHWQSSELSNPAGLELSRCFGQPSCKALTEQAFSVSLIEAVDPYQQTERAIKYAILVIVLSFAWFYLAELLSHTHFQLHPMHYLLVGLTLVMFYLLLLSLAELIGFLAAYWLASLACALLLYGYLTAVLQSKQRSVAVTAAYLALQGLLYLILQAETFALLSGTLLLFATLAVLMLSTRRLNWQQVWQSQSTPDDAV